MSRVGWFMRCFSLVAEIGWLASTVQNQGQSVFSPFQSRCRDWVVGEQACDQAVDRFMFQSRCRDWVVGERRHIV